MRIELNEEQVKEIKDFLRITKKLGYERFTLNYTFGDYSSIEFNAYKYGNSDAMHKTVNIAKPFSGSINRIYIDDLSHDDEILNFFASPHMLDCYSHNLDGFEKNGYPSFMDSIYVYKLDKNKNRKNKIAIHKMCTENIKMIYLEGEN